MAILQVDLSEYDAMRKSLADAENRVKELKEENKELKNSSKVIFRREVNYLTPLINTSDFAQSLRDEIQMYAYRGHCPDYHTLAAICVEVWKKLPKEYSKTIPTGENIPTQSDTLIGFDDVRLKIEEMFKEQFNIEHQQAIGELNAERDAYRTKYDSVYDEISGKFKATIEKLKKENNKLKEESEEINKDKELKLAESEKQVKELKEELDKFKTKKKHWFNR